MLRIDWWITLGTLTTFGALTFRPPPALPSPYRFCNPHPTLFRASHSSRPSPYHLKSSLRCSQWASFGSSTLGHACGCPTFVICFFSLHISSESCIPSLGPAVLCPAPCMAWASNFPVRKNGGTNGKPKLVSPFQVKARNGNNSFNSWTIFSITSHPLLRHLVLTLLSWRKTLQTH